ncbi:MAG: hypothetical protein AABW67_04215 [Nanoarchaeota archaeon]
MNKFNIKIDIEYFEYLMNLYSQGYISKFIDETKNLYIDLLKIGFKYKNIKNIKQFYKMIIKNKCNLEIKK